MAWPVVLVSGEAAQRCPTGGDWAAGAHVWQGDGQGVRSGREQGSPAGRERDPVAGRRGDTHVNMCMHMHTLHDTYVAIARIIDI